MSNERVYEKPSPKDFGFKVSKADREKGHVFIEYDGMTYKWFLRKEDRMPMLVNGDERELTEPLREAMYSQVQAILGKE